MQDIKYPFIIPEVSKNTIELFKKYIDDIHENKVYSNRGKFVVELEDVFSSRVGKECVLAANATLLLEAVHYFFRHEPMSLPLFTFPATNLGRMNLAHTSYADCNEKGVAIHRPTKVCITTIPFGNPKALVERPDCNVWIVDAASGLDPEFALVKELLKAGANLVIGSLHATKTLVAGEGGVVWGDELLLQRLRNYQNFGFSGFSNSRFLSGEGSNHKMSEFSAAFCLAFMEHDFVASYRGRIETADMYENFFTDANFSFIYSAQAFWFLSKTNSFLVCEKLKKSGVDARRYYYPILNANVCWYGCTAQEMARYGICLPTRSFLQSERDEILEVLKKELL